MESTKLVGYEGANKPDNMNEARPALAKHHNALYDDVATIETDLNTAESDISTLESTVSGACLKFKHPLLL